MKIAGVEFEQLGVGAILLDGDVVHDKKNQALTSLSRAGLTPGWLHSASSAFDFYRAKNQDLVWAMNTYARHGINDARMNRLMRKMIVDQGYDDIYVLGHLHGPLNFWELDVSLKSCLDTKQASELQDRSRINPDLQAGSNQASPAWINPEQPKESTEPIGPGIWDTLQEVRSARREGDGKEWVNHPDHYNNNPSGVEAIEVIEHMSFNLGNAVKYIWRAGDKGKFLEDLRKAAWYLNREIERVQVTDASQPLETD